eukprot:m.97297 g.97297  ORF g.97297 m.97297 type:complete len:341 (-) comp16694_c1_seq1:831-1853(-)
MNLLKSSAIVAASAFLLHSAYVIHSSDNTMSSSIRAAKDANRLLQLQGKHAVVVGGTSGIGRAIAERLANASCSVTIVGRESDRSRIVMEGLRKNVEAVDGQSFKFVKCNCFLLSDVSRCVGDVLESSPDTGIDFLVMTQGMATIQGFTPSKEEGLDQKLTLHVYSRAAFAKGLLPALEKSEDGRVLSVLSAGIHAPYRNYEKDPELSQGSYSIKAAADSAGFYNDIMLDSLSALSPKVSFFHASPGFVSTNWGTEMPVFIRCLVRGLQVFGKSKENCAEFMLRGLTAKDATGGFHLLDQYGLETPTVTSLHETAKEFVWKHIEKIIETGRSVQAQDSHK